VSVDYGLDLNVEIVENSQVTGKNFSVQLKATDKTMIHVANPSVRLKTSTLEYMRSRLEPVMIVYYSYADKDALWIWSHQIQASHPSNQETITIQFAKEQRLSSIDWKAILADVKLFFAAKPTTDQITATKLERFGRYRIDLSRATPIFREEVDDLETLINSPNVKESALQRFIEAHPEVMLGGEYVRLHAQLLLRGVGTELRPDFFVESVTGLCDILELKLPTERIISGRIERRMFSSCVQMGIAQVKDYSEFFEDRGQRRWFQDAYGLKVFRPLTILLVGRDNEFTDVIERRRLESWMGNFKIFTYDDLLRMARAHQVE
jgi:hypothetical protein